jgi:uncharacterized membrane protein YidH (DUF202 family)
MSAPGVAPASPIRDPGLQGERTALAWNRTGLAMLANALLSLRAGWASGHTTLSGLSIALLAASGATIAYGAWRRHELLSGAASIAPPATAIACAAVMALTACAAGLFAILGTH